MSKMLAWISGLLAFFLLSTPVLTYGDNSHNILLMLPYTQDYPAHEAFGKGLKNRIHEKSKEPFNYWYEYLSLASFGKSPAYLANTASYFQQKYAERQPELIVAGGALAPFLTEYGMKIFPGVPVVMAWNQPDGLSYELPKEFVLIKGLSMDNYDQNIQLILRVRPSAKKIFVVIGDGAEERMISLKMALLVKRYADRVELILLNKLPYKSMLDRISKAGKDSAVLFLRWATDVEGRGFIPAQVLKTILGIAKVPVFGTSSHLFDGGLVGGYLYNHEIVGRLAADASLQVLKGEIPKGLQVSISLNEYLFDRRQLDRWGILDKLLPPGSRIEYNAVTPWEQYGKYVLWGVALFILETGLVLALWINLVRRKRAEHELEALNVTLEHRVQERTRELTESNEELERAHIELESLNKQLEQHSRTDSLTGLSNRRHMEEKLLEEHEKYVRTGVAYSVALGDIDLFKLFNDKYGHDAGDYILASVSKELQKPIRSYDTVARWGGEEFLLLFSATDEGQAMGMAERIRKSVEERQYIYGGQELSVTMTIGVASVAKGDSLDTSIKKADIALYRGKQAGRNCVISSQQAILESDGSNKSWI